MTTPTQPVPFLRHRDGRLELVLHPTGIQTHGVCPLKFWLSRGLEIERAVPSWPRNYGGAIHDALAFRYANLGLPLKSVQEEQASRLATWFERYPVPTEEWRNLGRAAQAIIAYNAHYPAHEWEVLGVEEEFSVSVGTIRSDSGEFVECVLEGRKDLVVSWHDGIWIVDHKTAMEWGDDPEKNQELLAGRRSFQFRAYAWAEREEQRLRRESVEPVAIQTDSMGTIALYPIRDTLPVRGVVGNYIIGRKPFSEAESAVKRRAGAGKPRDQWHQEFFAFDDAVLDEWRDQFLLKARRILRDYTSGEWEASYDRGCAYYGRCEFYDYCEESPETREATLSSALYRRKEPATTTNETEDP